MENKLVTFIKLFGITLFICSLPFAVFLILGSTTDLPETFFLWSMLGFFLGALLLINILYWKTSLFEGYDDCWY